MYALCIESSHARGMGHLFRALVLYRFLLSRGERALLIVNDDERAKQTLDGEGVEYIAVERLEGGDDWETGLIEARGITVWLNDRMETGLIHAERVLSAEAMLASIDDCGEGSRMAQLNFAPMTLDPAAKPGGRIVLRDFDYLILSSEIAGARRLRKSLGALAVTLGGSDTHGVTLAVVAMLMRMNLSATLFLGPSFMHSRELSKLAASRFELVMGVPSLICALQEFDLAITGGGVTALEAAAAGLPTLIVANEPHEVYTAKRLEQLGCARYVGYRDGLPDRAQLPGAKTLEAMSAAGIHAIPLNGVENIYRELKEAEEEWKKTKRS